MAITKMKHVVCYIPENKHNEFKAALAIRGLNIQAFVEGAIDKFLDSIKKIRGEKNARKNKKNQGGDGS